ncbi:hypothetical protein MAR_016768 [Mya arenaria]|uniref:B box-type domain-containing protein n=1 Tax=Mya arenaria TaxID=6604 RepID=A0ABY7EAE8_MYAAR|nr:uncharacterized protein LOC128237374 [Mya arenaria]XP_052808812.1 uncharacterized protein LOC128237374 [Mya arenaria]XP_052808813.1 uncharacterized protein LOC128237374 [Mya arenaria]WAR06810.1 hypothetical protein MAR_016768 [Mya arenaria]
MNNNEDTANIPAGESDKRPFNVVEMETAPVQQEALTNGIIHTFCDACRKQSLDNIAGKYCWQCRQNLCEKCVVMHGYFSALEQHTIVPILELSAREPGDACGTENVVAAVPTERCPKHPEKVIDMFCSNHEVVACSLCFLPHYKLCSDIHYVPDIAAKIVDDSSVERVKGDIETAKTSLDNVVLQCRGVMGDLTKAKEAALKAVKEFRTHLDDIIAGLENKTVTDLESRNVECDFQLESEIAKAERLRKRAHERSRELEVSDGNLSRLLVSQTLAKQVVFETDTLVKAVQKLTSKTRLYYKNDNSITNSLKNLGGLGAIRDQTFKFGSVKSKQKFDIQLEGEEQCNVWGSCLTGQGNIVLADNGNNKLKLLDKYSYMVIGQCPLPASPRSLFRISETEVVVSLSNKCIYFISTAEKTLTVMRHIKLDHNCFGLAFTDGELYISDGSQSVYVYKTDGEPVRTIEGTDEAIFSESRDITVSDDGSRIHVADSRKGLVTLSKEGRVLWRHAGSELKGAYGVCTDGSGNLLVTGILSHNIIQLGKNGERLCEIIKASDDVSSPVSVCFDRLNERVIVTKIGNVVYSFEFEW